MNILIYILIAGIPLPIFWVVFRFKFRYLGFGLIALVIAYFLETFEESMVGGGYIGIMVLFLAPVIEESLKVIFTVFEKNLKSGVGIGLGFAIAENVLYFQAYGYMLPQILLVREFQDPLLHTTTTGVASGAWKKWWRYPLAIGLHSLYNLVAITNSPILVSIMASLYGMLLYTMLRKEKRNKKEKMGLENLNVGD